MNTCLKLPAATRVVNEDKERIITSKENIVTISTFLESIVLNKILFWNMTGGVDEGVNEGVKPLPH